MQELAGIGVSFPGDWSSQYQTNLQNAILDAGLVPEPKKIYFVEETTATVLACLQPAAGSTDLGSTDSGPADSTLHLAAEGLAFVVSAGASTTELALVDLATLAKGQRPIATHSIAYGGLAIDQDILYHLLYPQLQASPLAEVEQLLSALQLDTLERPQLSQPDSARRRQLQLRLCSSNTGRRLLAIAQFLKHELQTQPRATYTLAQHRGQVTQDELGHQILLPYIQTINQQVESLIQQAGVSPQAIQQVICSGGTASMPVVALWARRCFSEATLLSPSIVATSEALTPGACINQVSEGQDAPVSSAWLGSQVGYGLANLPLHPALVPNLAPMCQKPASPDSAV